MTTTTIIPVSSGKGGVGKSLVAANLAIAMAEQGYSTIAIDLDFGGANLHSFLGIPNNYAGIGDYLKARVAELEELLVPTAFEHLKFLPGDVRSPFMANIPFAQKIRLIHNIQKLSADYIFLDLGAGSSFNILDFFALAPHGLLVTTAEYTSIMNMMTFLKNFIFRIIERALPKKEILRQLVQNIYTQPMKEGPVTVTYLLDKIADADADAAQHIRTVCQQYRPRLIFNQGYHPDELKLMEQINGALNKNLSLTMDYFGFIFEDPTVRQYVRREDPLIPRESLMVEDIKAIADRISRLWKQTLDHSGSRLLEETQRVYRARYKEPSS
ncbi:P-loop NTPase [Deltaproteobacteria bacterium TL4]